MTAMTTITHHHLNVEQVSDDQGQAIIMLTQQDGHSEPSTVLVHPWQLRAVCEQFEIIASDPQAARTIARLKRQLLVLRDRIDHLGNYLTHHSDHDHADLSYELTYITATADIAAEFCVDLLDTAAPAPAQCKPDVSAVKASTPATAGKPGPTALQASLV